MIDFEKILKPETVEIVERCESRKSILERASTLLSRNQAELDRRGLLEKFIEREELGSTTLDDSEIAIPHCRHDRCKAPSAALLRVDTGVPFGREEQVRLIVALVVPAEASKDHLDILRTICAGLQRFFKSLPASGSSVFIRTLYDVHTMRPRGKRHVRLYIITGRSGSGKSTVLHALEDEGFMCIDNFPARLLEKFVEDTSEEQTTQDFAVSIDARSPPTALDQLPSILKSVARDDFTPRVIYLDASGPVLVKRFSETRRRHPLEKPKRIFGKRSTWNPSCCNIWLK